MQRGRSVKRRIMAWVLSLVMAASVIMVPVGKVEAAGDTVTVENATDSSKAVHVVLEVEKTIAANSNADHNWPTEELSQYKLTIVNGLSTPISDWEITINTTGTMYYNSGWNGAPKSASGNKVVISTYQGTDSAGEVWTNATVKAGETLVTGAGFQIGTACMTGATVTLTYKEGKSEGGAAVDDTAADPSVIGTSSADVSAVITDTTSSGSGDYHEYLLQVNNNSSESISDWLVAIPITGITSAEQWGDWAKVKISYTPSYLYLTPSSSGDNVITVGGTFGSTTDTNFKFNYKGSNTLITANAIVYYKTGTSSSGAFNAVVNNATAASGGSSSGGGSGEAGEQVDSTTDLNLDIEYNYAKLLQYSLYFYDANMCGPDVKTNCSLSWRGNCHTYDQTAVKYNDKTIDVSGGFHDAGDHDKFGLPEGYSATMLGIGYYEFKEAYEKTGQTEHFRKILDHFCDYFVRCTVLDDTGNNAIAFCYQVGDGSSHSYWLAPEKETIARPAYFADATTPATDQVSEAVAALTIHYLNFGNSEYLNYAKKLFAMAQKNNKAKQNAQNGTFYDSSSWEDDYCLAAAWLYKATEESNYLTEFNKYKGNVKTDGWPSWDDVGPYALAYGANDWSALGGNVTATKNGCTNVDNGFAWLAKWASNRYNANMQLEGLIYDKYMDKDFYTSWAEGQMKFIIGNNTSKRCYIVGYNENSSKYPHHRASSGYPNFPDQGYQQTPQKHVLLGALVGGIVDSSGTYQDSAADYYSNEVTLDYNAAFTGALAAFYLKNQNDGVQEIVTSSNADDTAKSVIDTFYNDVNAETTISLSKKAMSIAKGESEILIATVSSEDKSVTWSTSEESVATVDSTGKVTAIGKGTAVITAETTDGKKATCNVTVTVPVASITLNKTALTLITTDDAKKTATLAPTVLPADADEDLLRWESSNPEVATVNADGVVTAVGDGTTTITVATESGSKSATCEVTVVAPIESVKITDADGNDITDRAMAVDAEETVKALVNPSEATGRDIVEWTITSGEDVVSLEDIAGSHDVKVKALNTGTATVKVTVGKDIGEGVDKISNVKEETFNITVSNIIKDVTLTDNESKTSKTMTIGDTVSLNALYDPEAGADKPYSVNWESSDDAVSVNVVDDTDKKSATVTALKSTAGEEVTITLTVVPAENAKAIVKEYKVIVKKKTQAPPADISIGVSERTATSITVNVTPDAVGKTYQYSFDGGESWQDESTATGLEEATTYNVKIRYKETADFEASEPAAATLKVGTLLSVTTPYTIDVSRLPGGANYTDDTYVNALYISDNESGKEPSATYEDGKLTLLPGRDYKLSGSNDSLTISYKQDETASGTSSEDNTTVTLDNAAIKTVDAQATIKISGKTTVDGDVKADKVDVTDGAKEIKVSGDVDADTVNVAAGTGEVSVTGKVSADKVSVSSGTVKVDDGIKAASEVAITGGTVEATGDKDTAAIEAAAVSISGGSVNATGTEGGAAIKGDTVTVSGGEVTATGKDEGSVAITGATVELSGGTVAATAGAGASAIEGTDAVTIGSSVKLSVNSSKKSDGTVVAAINSKAITIDENADIKADDNAKTNLFSVTPKDTNGVAVDVTKYIGKTEDVSQPKGDENKSTTPAGQSDGGDQTSQPIKATDMIITAGVKGVTGVTLSGTYQLALKKTLTVAVTFSPENAVNESVTVTSSNPKVVAVSGTKLTAKKAGTAKITVTSENGLTKTFSVKVMKKSVSKVKLKASKKTVKVGKTLKLKATTTPSKKKASNKLYWSSSDEGIATVTQKGAVKGVKKGKVKITATALDGSGKKATLKITVK